ncbi:hypothetical protein [Streptomyces sp. NPDC020298]|uniref:hypothetical protein n=1 Tax=unclassified Streptomyces TaxID=2593676 RepID=UPI00340CC767
MARCPQPCGKHRYGSEAVAQLACVQAAMRGKPHLIWYRARACQCWHLSNPSRHERGKGGKRGQWVRQFTPDQSTT